MIKSRSGVNPVPRLRRFARSHHRRSRGYNWYSIESYFSAIKDAKTLRELRKRVIQMANDDEVWKLIEAGIGYEKLRAATAEAAQRRIDHYK